MLDCSFLFIPTSTFVAVNFARGVGRGFVQGCIWVVACICIMMVIADCWVELYFYIFCELSDFLLAWRECYWKRKKKILWLVFIYFSIGIIVIILNMIIIIMCQYYYSLFILNCFIEMNTSQRSLTSKPFRGEEGRTRWLTQSLGLKFAFFWGGYHFFQQFKR